jgi:Cu-Zn family superoxide dismutase
MTTFFSRPARVGALAAVLLGALAPTAAASAPAAQDDPAATAVEQGPRAMAILRNAAGEQIATAVFTEDAAGVRVIVQVAGLAPGEYGIHVHAVARCDPPDFTSAGAHFNPSQRAHGLQNPAGPHEGDLPNLVVDPTGTATYSTTTPLVTLGLGNPAALLFDGDGSALVIHAGSDDQVSDPIGNSGDRIACGVIMRS